jgi:hypothetical protein
MPKYQYKSTNGARSSSASRYSSPKSAVSRRQRTSTPQPTIIWSGNGVSPTERTPTAVVAASSAKGRKTTRSNSAGFSPRTPLHMRDLTDASMLQVRNAMAQEELRKLRLAAPKHPGPHPSKNWVQTPYEARRASSSLVAGLSGVGMQIAMNPYNRGRVTGLMNTGGMERHGFATMLEAAMPHTRYTGMTGPQAAALAFFRAAPAKGERTVASGLINEAAVRSEIVSQLRDRFFASVPGPNFWATIDTVPHYINLAMRMFPGSETNPYRLITEVVALLSETMVAQAKDYEMREYNKKKEAHDSFRARYMTSRKNSLSREFADAIDKIELQNKIKEKIEANGVPHMGNDPWDVDPHKQSPAVELMESDLEKFFKNLVG